MSEILITAAKAAKLCQQGKTCVEIKLALGLRTAADAFGMVRIGKQQIYCDEAALSPQEIGVLLNLACVERDRNRRGDVSAFSLTKWNRGADLRLIRKRLGPRRRVEPLSNIMLTRLADTKGTGLGLINHHHGGFCHLTRAGWSLVHVLERGVTQL